MGYKRAEKELNVPNGILERCVKDNIKSPDELAEINLGTH
jgi:hypothetical protein